MEKRKTTESDVLLSGKKELPRLVILGGGESGTGAAVLAKQKGWDAFVSDAGKIKDKYKNVLLHHGITYEEGKHSDDLILSAAEVVKSPGIPDDAEIVLKLKRRKISVISEIEFAARYTKAKLIGITGTNGKTTTTHLVYHILKKAGRNVKMAGNVGKSFAQALAEGDANCFVLELSNFQLDGMFKTRIHTAILLNITPDHLDRYHYHLQDYIRSKFRIVQNQTPEDAFIYCIDDKIIAKEIRKKKFSAQQFPFSIRKKIKLGAWLENNQLNIKTNINQKSFTMFVESLALQGKHNQYNSMAAGIAACVIDVQKPIVRESLSDFQNIEHRLEWVSKVNGVEFINDSKATNVNSTWYALESMQRPTVWIVGGIDKGNDYSPLKELVRQKVKAIVCLGKDNKKIIRAFKKIVDVIIETHSAEEAVRVARRLAVKGDTVLLSPACSSFDLFSDYEDRGRKFKQAVKAL